MCVCVCVCVCVRMNACIYVKKLGMYVHMYACIRVHFN